MILILKYIYKFCIIIILVNGIEIIKLSKNVKILLCTIAKQENKYIKEFIEYYKNMKINKIIIFDNNDIDGEYLEEVLYNEKKNNFIKIVNFRGLKHPQIKALNKCYQNYNKYFEWIAFFDIDEFLYIKNYTNLNKFLSLPQFNKCQSIIINWKYFGDNNNLFYEPKPLKERFNKEFDIRKIEINEKYIFYYSAGKSIIRGGLKLKWGHFPHYIDNNIKCRPNGEIINNYFSPPQYSTAYISHYFSKSTEEFIERLKRGDVMVKPDDEYYKQRIFNYYFLFNKITKEKLNLFKKEKFIK